MIPKQIKCDGCGYDIEAGTYRKIIKMVQKRMFNNLITE